MTDGEEKMIEIMPLILEEIRVVKQELREIKLELDEVKHEITELKQAQHLANMRLSAIEYDLSHENPEFRTRLELFKNGVGRLEQK